MHRDVKPANYAVYPPGASGAEGEAQAGLGGEQGRGLRSGRRMGKAALMGGAGPGQANAGEAGAGEAAPGCWIGCKRCTPA